MNQIDITYTCPYCFESIETLVDPSILHQVYVEDCQVCCNPMEFSIQVSNGEVIDFQASRLE